ncbi:MAG: B12-binding domain-containing radical SAM protein [Planctomycetota bacterium]|nr:MAG: B12-binding domain-containing radical SAM protein [Planctomycetota bacterium]
MKIGLLAMSGLRAHDPDLLALGLTLPGVIRRGEVVASLPSLGLLYLAAVTPEGHDLRYYEADRDRAEPAELYDSDLVAISTFSAQAFEAYAIADRLRAAGVRVAIGGLHASVEPDEALAHADFVLVGEAEETWPRLVEALAAGNVDRRLWRAGDFPSVDVRTLPVPRYDLLAGRAYNRFTVQTSRGCPWRCDFCASTVMLTKSYRKRPVEHVRRDIEALKRFRKRPFVELADDNTFVDKDWGKELCRQLIPLGVNWFTETDVSVADDDELLRLLRRSRCRQVLIGLESPEQESLEGMELHANFKARRWATAKDAVRRIQDHGITVNGCFILGLDAHGPDVFEHVLEFALEIPLYEVQITVLTPFPGTPLYERFLAEGRLIEPRRWDLCTLFDVNYRPARMTVDELRRGVYWLAERLYSADCIERRQRPFFERLWANRETAWGEA